MDATADSAAAGDTLIDMTSLASSPSPAALIPADRVDFVLAWHESGSNKATKLLAASRRSVFERNLRNEGLVLEREGNGNSGEGVHFVKIHAPDDVLKRYAEILKLRLPMKKFDHVSEIHVGDFRIPIVSDVYDGILNRFLAPFRVNTSAFPAKSDELTATFSRDREYLFDMSHPDLFTPSSRSRIIEFILKRKRLSDDNEDEFDFGVERALAEGVYIAAYPLHDGSLKATGCMRQRLYAEWASFTKMLKFQPLDAVRDYYGVKIGLYFAWLGFYTNLLILPSIVGLLVFIYGIISMGNDVPSKDICAASDVTICPPCDYFCDYWSLNETCLHSKIMYLFDNETTVFFAVFMSFWAVLFLEFWKRYSSEIAHRWDVTGFHPEEEHPRPEYLAKLGDVQDKTINFVTQTTEPKVPFWSRRFPGIMVSCSSVLFMIVLGLATVIGVILYRMAMVVALSAVDDEIITSHASLFIAATGACINLVCILIFDQIYGCVAVRLTEMELNRTQTEFDESLSLKIYLLQFVNYYASIFYIAFFKGKFVGYPGRYNRFISYRQEECSPGGCFMELFLQLAILFVGKQFLLSIVEYQLPKLWKLYNACGVVTGLNSRNNGNGKQEDVADGNMLGSRRGKPQWVQDFKLVEWGKQGLFYEYLEMVIQYGFITIFVSAFPLAPLFALVNNIFELRLDAKKLLVHYRRPVAQRVRDIGIWLNIMESLGRIAVITNGLIIAFTSEFIPKMVYKIGYSPDYTLSGYTNFSLSYFDPADFERRAGNGNATAAHHLQGFCRYHDFRYPPGHEKEYQLTEVYWHILAARLAFVVLFQNAVGVSVMALKWVVPSMAVDLRQRIRREAYLTNEIIIRNELLKAKGVELQDQDASVATEMASDTEQHTVDSSSLAAEECVVRRGPSAGDGQQTGDVTDGNIVV